MPLERVVGYRKALLFGLRNDGITNLSTSLSADTYVILRIMERSGKNAQYLPTISTTVSLTNTLFNLTDTEQATLLRSSQNDDFCPVLNWKP